MKKLLLAFVVIIISIGCEELAVYPGETPNVPSSPTPADSATDISLNETFNWLCTSPEGQPLTYDFYLGQSLPLTRLAEDISLTSYDVTDLVPNKQYFWKVVARDGRGLVQEGPIWRFSTARSVWGEITSPVSADLNAMAISNGTGWAVGDTATIVYFDGTNWADVSPTALSGFNDIVWDGTTGYTVGSGGIIYQLSLGGTSATISSPTTANISAVAFDSESALWIVCDNTELYKKVDGQWEQITIEIEELVGADLSSIATSLADEKVVGTKDGDVFFWDNDEWTLEVIGDSSETKEITCARYLSDYDGGTVELDGYWVSTSLGKIYFRSGTDTWEDRSSYLGGSINGFKFYENTGMAAIGGGAVSRFTGSGWSSSLDVSITDINDVNMLNNGEAYAVGAGGKIFYYGPVSE